jgi:putative SOS response-associated peptidase YedK
MYDPEEIELEFGFKPTPVDWPPNDNVTPGEKIPIIINTSAREMKLMQWGLVPYWAKDPLIGFKTINACAETISEKPSFKSAFARRRCLIPATGFYEWVEVNGRKIPFKFTLSDRPLFAFAGIWECWQDRNGTTLETCAIITTLPNLIVAPIHDRMPAILRKETQWAWLENKPLDELQNMLAPYPSEKMAQPEKIDPAFFKRLK